MCKVIYKNTVKGVGPSVEAFGGEMMILFGENAPDTLKDFCYTIDVKKPEAKIEPGQVLKIGDTAFEILGVGEIAERNLTELGHLTVVFTGDEEALLPGAIVVEEKANPGMEIGTILEIIA